MTTAADRQRIRDLASRWSDFAAQPVMNERKRLWRAVHDLKMVKPIRGWLEELIQRDPKRPEGHAFLAMAYRELPSVVSWGDDKKALEHARVAQQLAPREPEALLELAEALRENGEKDAARDMYRRVQTSDVPRDLEWETEDARAWARKQLADMD